MVWVIGCSFEGDGAGGLACLWLALGPYPTILGKNEPVPPIRLLLPHYPPAPKRQLVRLSFRIQFLPPKIPTVTYCPLSNSVPPLPIHLFCIVCLPSHCPSAAPSHNITAGMLPIPKLGL